MTYEEALDALDRLYAELPAFTCQQQCQASCGVIVMSRLEWVRIQRKLGYKPKGKPTLVCPMLKQGRCSVHAIRPTICRIWGLVDMPLMRCPYGCIPARWMSEEEGYTWLAMADTISQQIYPHAEPSAPAQGIPMDKITAYIDECKKATCKYRQDEELKICRTQTP